MRRTGKSRSHRTSVRDNFCAGIRSNRRKIITESPELQGRHQIQMVVYSSRQPKAFSHRLTQKKKRPFLIVCVS